MTVPEGGAAWPGSGTATSGHGPASIELDEDSLRERVRQVLSKALGRTVSVTHLERSDSPFATLFPAHILDVELDGSERRRLFLKHLGTEERDHPDKLGPAREVSIYEQLFQQDDLPVPRCFGSAENAHTGRTELFLEYVDDWNLKYHDLALWYRAAHELGRLHAHFAARCEGMEGVAPLQRLGADYARSWARRAVHETARREEGLADRLESVLARYDAVAAVLEEAPRTLVHNDLAPKNVLADRAADPVRICFVDWECAGVGTGVLDLVNLSYGLDPDPRGDMRRAYLRGLREGGGPIPGMAELRRLEAASEAHKALWRVAHCGVWGLEDSSVGGFIAEAESALARLLDDRPMGGVAT